MAELATPQELSEIARNLRCEVEIRTVKTTDVTLRLDGDYIVRLLRAVGVKVPDNASVEFHVPGGADWSNTSIEVDEEHQVTVSWREVTDG